MAITNEKFSTQSERDTVGSLPSVEWQLFLIRSDTYSLVLSAMI